MSMSIDELNSIYGLYGVNGLTQNSSQMVTSAETEKKATDGDSYISTIAGIDTSAAIPSENYNDFAKMVKTTSKATGVASATEYASVADGTADTSQTQATEEISNVGGNGGSGGSESSDSDEDTETEVVTINGQTYLQTTTTDSSGNTTVTRVPIGVASVNNDGKAGEMNVASAAQITADM